MHDAIRTGFMATVASVLCACAPMIPKTERPQRVVADEWPTALEPPGSSSRRAASDIEWQSFFVDERMKRLVSIALANNRDLRVALLNIDAARATVTVRGADFFPTLGAALNGTRQRPGQTGGLTSVYTAGVAISAWELDFFGRIRSLSASAQAQALASEEAARAVQTALVASVANVHLALLADEEALAVTRETLKTREESLRLVKLKFDNGASSEFDLRQAESLLEAARVALAQQTRQRMLDENALTLLIGQPLPAGLPPPRPLGDPGLLADIPAGLPSDLLTRRADLRQAEQQLAAADANIGAARAAFFPRIALTASVGRASSQLDGLVGSGGVGAWSFAPSLLLPIFDAGRNRANLALSRVNRDIAVAQYERAIQTAFREVADALAGRATYGEQLRAQLAQTQAEEARFKLADLRYRHGAASHLDILDAQRSLFAAKLALVQVQAQAAQNLVTLYRVLGGGWSPPGDASANPAR